MTLPTNPPPGAPADAALLALIERINSGALAPAEMSPAAAELAWALARPWTPLAGRLAARSFTGPVTGRSVPYLAYEPAGYDQSQATYPVLYHFHGLKPFPTWTPLVEAVLMREANRVAAALEAAVAAGSAPPMLIIFPFAYGDTFWADSRAGDGPAATNFNEELVPHVAATYRVRPERAAHLLSGYSMGGFGALTLAATQPDQYAFVVSYDGAFYNWAALAANKPEIAARHFEGERAYFEPFSPWIHLAENVTGLRTGLNLNLFLGDRVTYHRKLVSYLRYLEIPFLETRSGCDHDLDCLLTNAGPTAFTAMGQHLADHL